MSIRAFSQMSQLRIGFGESSRIVQVAVVREKSRIHGGGRGLAKVCTGHYLNFDNCQCLNLSAHQPRHIHSRVAPARLPDCCWIIIALKLSMSPGCLWSDTSA